ncbi:MAG: methyltransferase domain-containing protein [Acetobacteraceae bacterium]
MTGAVPGAEFDPEAVRSFEHARWQAAAPIYGTTFAAATAPFIAPLLDAAGLAAGVVPDGAPAGVVPHGAPAKRLLDVACGPGFVASAAALRGAVACGVDFSSAMLAVARARDPGVRFDAGDAERLPYADAAFEVVVSNFGIHHVPRPLFALREAHRVLGTGGRVAFSFWAAPAENVAWRLVFDAVARYGDRSAASAPVPGGGFATPEQCADALRSVGFTDCTTLLVRATWRHRDAGGLVAALRAGTARMAAMLEAQSSATLAAITADIELAAAPYRDGEDIALPIAAVIASGVRR